MTSPHEPSELAGSSIQSRESTPTPLVMPRRRILENVHIQRDIQVLQRELGEDDIEELIITDGARSFASSSIPYHQDPANDDDTEEESVVDEQAVTTVARIEFLPPDQLPSWFSENIKKIYLVDRHGGALSFKVCIYIEFPIIHQTYPSNLSRN